MPVSLYLHAKDDYHHAIIKQVEGQNMELRGTGSVNGHTDRVAGSALLWVYRPSIPAFEIGLVVNGIPEW
jgi:hypothetical protein